jgi:LCP family protein required for cell wall assembly
VFLPEVTPIPWDGSTRVTILLLGLDYRDWEAGLGAPRSDSMILLSVDPLTKQVSMLSIPRDLWVEIPGFTHNRINTAYASGEGNRLPGGGPALAMRAAEALVGVPIQYYAVIDFSTFERMIDEIGGIDVLVMERIKIAPIGRLAQWLDPKAYHLDGAQALAYARVRKATGGDFGRAERQQQVAMAILDRVTGFDMIPTLVAKAPTLYQELSTGCAQHDPERDDRPGLDGPGYLFGKHPPRCDRAAQHGGVLYPTGRRPGAAGGAGPDPAAARPACSWTPAPSHHERCWMRPRPPGRAGRGKRDRRTTRWG